MCKKCCREKCMKEGVQCSGHSGMTNKHKEANGLHKEMEQQTNVQAVAV